MEPAPHVEDDGEPEPRLEYERLEGDVPLALAGAAATAFAASPKALALGAADGRVRLLDLAGNEVALPGGQGFRRHGGAVTGLCFDAAGGALASCAADGTVAVTPLDGGGAAAGGALWLAAPAPATCVALDPRWSSRRTQEVVYGTVAGALVLASRGWLGPRAATLFHGRAAVAAAAFGGPLLAWAAGSAVRVADTATHARLGKLERPRSAGGAGAPPARLHWAGERELFVAWGRAVVVARVVDSGAGAPPPAAGARARALQVVAAFEVGGAGCVAAGAAPYGADVAVLVWRAAGGGGAATLRIVARSGRELSSDVVELEGLGDAAGGALAAGCPVQLAAVLSPAAAALAAAAPPAALGGGAGGGAAAGDPNPAEPGAEVAAAGGFSTWWRAGEEPTYLVVSPRAVAVGRPRGAAARVAWLGARGRFAAALAVAEGDAALPPAARAALADAALERLGAREGRWADAAALAPRLLAGDAGGWERWAFRFSAARALPALAAVLPPPGAPPGGGGGDPLPRQVYDMAAAACLRSPADQPLLLALLRRWPPSGYDGAALLRALEPRLGGAAGPWSSPGRAAPPGPQDAAALRAAAALLHSAAGRHDDAVRLMLAGRDPAAFEYLGRHAALALAAPHAAALFELDEGRAAALLVAARDEAPPGRVVAALLAAGRAAAAAGGGGAPPGAAAEAEGDEDPWLDCLPAPGPAAPWSRRLHAYLDGLAGADPAAAAPHAGLRVRLLAAHAPGALLHFLATAPSYPLEAARRACEARGLVREAVYVLGRMGSAAEALTLTVTQLRDVAAAVEFAALHAEREPEGLELGAAAAAGGTQNGRGGGGDLWALLLALASADAGLAGALLDAAAGGAGGGALDPAAVVRALPDGLAVERLRERLTALLGEARARGALAAGGAAAARADLAAAAAALHAALRAALRGAARRAPGGAWVWHATATGAERPIGEGWEPPAAPAADGAGWDGGRVWVGKAPRAGAPAAEEPLPAAPTARAAARSPSKFTVRRAAAAE